VVNLAASPMKKCLFSFGCAFSLLFCTVSATARILDDFNDNIKTAWTDFTFIPGFGIPKEEGGQFKFALPKAPQAVFVASTKSSETFTIENGKRIEFRVDLVSGNGKDSFAILAFIPTTSQVSSLAGYGFSKSTTDILITKGIGKYFHNENPAVPLKNENVTMVLSLTGDGPNVVINAKLLDKDANNAIIFERTYVDTPSADVLRNGTDSPAAPYVGTGNFVLMCYEDLDQNAPQDLYEVVFDNAEAFVLERTVLDDFNDNTKTSWQDFTFQAGFGLPKEENGTFIFEQPPANRAIFSASSKTSRIFELVEGERVEFRVDLVTGNAKDSFAILSFVPTGSQVSTLAGYGFAKSTTDILLTKGIGKYFHNENPPVAVKNENVTLVLSLTVRGGSVEINGKVLDKDDNNAVLFEKTYIDTIAADILRNGTDDPAKPYLGGGNFTLFLYQDFDAGAPENPYRVVYDNAIVWAAPALANTAPIITEVSPEPFSNFLPATTTISFKVTDDKAPSTNLITLTLNGQMFTSTNGLNITGTGNSRTITLSGLSPNTNYIAILRAADAEGLSNSFTLYFDTFATNNLVVEVEDFNFNGGQFFQHPVPIAEGSGPQENSYSQQQGVVDVDYTDTRSNFQNVPYRSTDSVRMQQSRDIVRQKFKAAGGSENMVFDYDVGDVAAGEWLNYTRNFVSGSYEIYLREALVNGTQIETALEEVTSDPAQPNQTTVPLGSFRTPTTGYLYRNVPLTDATGQTKVVVRLSGKRTLRLRQVTAQPADGAIYQNYLIFVAVPDAGLQRAVVTSVSPSGRVETFTPVISATIQNRETTVRTDSIKLFVDGNLVNPSVTPTGTGATVSYTLASLPAVNSTVRVRLEFQDNQSATVTNEWEFVLTYLTVNPAYRQAGTGVNRGMKLRFVQAPAGSSLENSLARAEAQLASNSTIPKAADVVATNQVVNFSKTEGDRDYFPGDVVPPGLDVETNGSEDFVVEMTGYIELRAGVHRFGFKTDDGYKLTFGASPNDLSAIPISFRNGGTADQTVDFLVQQAGLYPFRFLWYERGGSAYAEWFSVDTQTGDRTLINDPDVPTAIKTFTSVAAADLVVQSSATVNGTYANDPTAVIDTAAKRITIPRPSGNRFYRLSAPTAQRITSAQVSGASIVLNYTAN
jgi:hypothetical protein